MSDVIIAPTRGSNLNINTSQAILKVSHHRPYEGQQPSYYGARYLARESSSPLRGAATMNNRTGMHPTRSHHRPYEGQQLVPAMLMNTSHAGHHRPYEGQQHQLPERQQLVGVVSSSPLRGAATSWRRSRITAARRSVIIAPTRGSNMAPGPGR